MRERNYVGDANSPLLKMPTREELSHNYAAAIFEVATITMLVDTVWLEAMDELLETQEYLRLRGVKEATRNVKWELNDCREAIRRAFWHEGENSFVQDFAVAANEVVGVQLERLSQAVCLRLSREKRLPKALPVARLTTAQALASEGVAAAKRLGAKFEGLRVKVGGGRFADVKSLLAAMGPRSVNEEMKRLLYRLLAPYEMLYVGVDDDPTVKIGLRAVINTMEQTETWRHALATAQARNSV